MSCGCALLAYALTQVSYDRPATLTFEIENWENRSPGIHDIDRMTGTGRIAISADGSTAHRLESKRYRYYFILNYAFPFHAIYDRPHHIGYRIDDVARAVTLDRCACTWEFPPSPPASADCAGRVTESESYKTSRGQSTGVAVIRYHRAGKDEHHKIAFAPGHACQIMEESRTRYNSLGWPTSSFRFRILTYAPGEPSRDHFATPPNYAITERRP